MLGRKTSDLGWLLIELLMLLTWAPLSAAACCCAGVVGSRSSCARARAASRSWRSSGPSDVQDLQSS